MLKRRHHAMFKIILLLFSLVCFLPSATFAGEKATPRQGGKLVVGALKDIVTLHAFQDTRSWDYDVKSLIYEGLTGVDRDWNIVPTLVEKWDISKDGLEYTFHLKKGVKFHNGQPLTSADVKWSIEFIMDRKNRAHAWGQMTKVKSVEAPDPLTVQIMLNGPYSPLTTSVSTARVPIVPRNSTFSPSAYAPGTGPFRFAEYKPGQQLVLRAFRDYWVKGIPYLDEVVIRPIQESNVRITALRAGDIDFADELPYQIVEQAQAGKHPFKIAELRAGTQRRVTFNLRIPPFNDVRLRQAVALAIDKAEVAQGQAWGFAKPTNQGYPSFSKWHIDLPDTERDLEKARVLVREAGFKDGLKAKVPVYPGPDMELTTLVQGQLRKIGIEIELWVLDWASQRKAIRDKEFTLYTGGAGVRPDADHVYYDDLHSKGGRNESGYSNSQMDQLLERARAVLDFKERKEIYRQALQLVLRDAPEIYLYHGSKFLGYRPQVKGYIPGGTEDIAAYLGGGFPYTWMDAN
jgi:peptide/nickel transport system substrate-binding protein